MPEENADNNQTGDPPQPRESSGRFTSKTKTEPTVQSQPTDSEYTKMNSRLAQQLGLTDKLADYQTKYNPRDLYSKLDFMADNSVKTEGTQPKGGLPPNQPIAQITPSTEKYELPGIQISTPNLTKQNFSVHYKIPFKEIIGKKK